MKLMEMPALLAQLLQESMYQEKQLLLQCFGECSCSVSCVCKMLVFFSEVRIEAGKRDHLPSSSPVIPDVWQVCSAFSFFLKPSYLHSKEFGAGMKCRKSNIVLEMHIHFHLLMGIYYL